MNSAKNQAGYPLLHRAVDKWKELVFGILAAAMSALVTKRGEELFDGATNFFGKKSMAEILVLSVLGLTYLILERCSVVRIYKATYYTPDASKDVTETVRKAAEEERMRFIPATNDFFAGSDIDYGKRKKLTVEYSKFGQMRRKTVGEYERLKL